VNWQTWIRVLWGRTPAEVAKSALVIGLAVALGIVAGYAERGTRSPRPRKWNVYSSEANDHIYTSRKLPPPAPPLLIAHAAGSLGELRYSNSIEALETNYARGFRFFELDFNWTSDGEIVLQHDWHAFNTLQRIRGPSMKEFLGRSRGSFTPTTLGMLYAWLERHHDAYVVTDTKVRGLEVLARIRMERPLLVPQFIPQIYLMEDYPLVRDQGYRYVILTLYRGLQDVHAEKLLAFSKTHPLFAITMPLERARGSDLAMKLRRAGVPCYAHTINDRDLFRELKVRGIHGVYTDTLDPRDFETAPAQ